MGLKLEDLRYFLEAKAARRRGSSPRSVLFPVAWVTARCNLRCRMCDQWKADPRLFQEELSTAEWCSFIDATKRTHAVALVITGGEPLLRGDIFDIVAYAHKKGISTHLCSNATLLDERSVRRLKESGLGSISVSLDSYDPKIHNQLRGVECFQQVVQGIRILGALAPRIRVGINYVITRINFRNMKKMIGLAESLKARQIKFDIIHTNLTQRSKSLESFQGLLFETADIPLLRREIAELIDTLSRSRLLSNSRGFLEGIPVALGEGRKRLPCYAGYISCAVDSLGRVSPCDNFDGEQGLRDKPFEEILASREFRAACAQVKDCQACCWDTTHAELNLRCSSWNLLKDIPRAVKETGFYIR